MNGGILQPALRQLRTRFRDSATLAVMVAVALVLGVSGPFGTFTALELPARLAYWAIVVPLTYGAGLAGSVLAAPRLARFAPPVRMAFRALASALLVGVVLLLLNTALGFADETAASLSTSFAALYAICLAVEGLGHVLSTRAAPASADPAPLPPQTAPLLLRLPFDKRGPLIRLAMQDHYVEVVTTKGRAMLLMLLMRMGDAIAECAPVPGFHAHRSHWVALDQIARARRQDDSFVLVLHSGAEIPLARSRIKAAQAAGLLPQKGRD